LLQAPVDLAKSSLQLHCFFSIGGSFRESTSKEKEMEWPITLIIFVQLPNDFELSILIKLIFAVISVFIVIFGLLVHQRILSFVKKNDGRHVDQIIAFQSVVNCFLIPISLSWLVGLQWLGEMKQYLSPQGCYIGTFFGKQFLTSFFTFTV
jgi:hypothetical protein